MSVAKKLKPEQELSALTQMGLVSRRILVVEDEPGIVQAYQDILAPKSNVVKIKSSRSKPTAGLVDSERAGFEMTSVTNGEEAIAAVKKSLNEGRPFAMGFFDVLLGQGIDGIETVRQVHELDPDLYAVLVTAYQDRHVNAIQEIFGKDFEAGWDYLNKPFSEGEILQKARNMVAMWNLRQQSREQRARIDEIKRKIGESERFMTVGAVARNVSHEFGNILLQIMGRADLARKAPEAEKQRALEMILTASEHASQVLKRFKDLAKPSEWTSSFSPVNINHPIEETCLLMSHDLKRFKIEVVQNVVGLPPIMASHTALVQVFMNLVINAIHAMEDKGGGRIEFTGKQVGEEIHIDVRDTGTGIKDEHIASIFEAFFTTKGERGTGLGLSICKEIIEINHGGSLTVSNHSHGGAVFHISLPIKHENTSEEEDPS